MDIPCWHLERGLHFNGVGHRLSWSPMYRVESQRYLYTPCFICSEHFATSNWTLAAESQLYIWSFVLAFVQVTVSCGLCTPRGAHCTKDCHVQSLCSAFITKATLFETFLIPQALLQPGNIPYWPWPKQKPLICINPDLIPAVEM